MFIVFETEKIVVQKSFTSIYETSKWESFYSCTIPLILPSVLALVIYKISLFQFFTTSYSTHKRGRHRLHTFCDSPKALLLLRQDTRYKWRLKFRNITARLSLRSFSHVHRSGTRMQTDVGVFRGGFSDIASRLPTDRSVAVVVIHYGDEEEQTSTGEGKFVRCFKRVNFP